MTFSKEHIQICFMKNFTLQVAPGILRWFWIFKEGFYIYIFSKFEQTL